MKYIGVFCSANDLDEKYTKPAIEFARLLATNGYSLVWGASDKGLMKQVVSTVAENGGKLIGVSIDVYKDVARKDADEIIIARNLSERKTIMLKRSDAIALLVGGIGTLDEITEIIELKKQKVHNKPIVVLNTKNFYEGLRMQFKKMKDDGFLTVSIDDIIHFVDQPEEAIEYINQSLNLS